VHLVNPNTNPILTLLMSLVFVVAISRWTTNLIRRRASGRVVGDIVRDLRNDAFRSAMSRDMSFYDEFSSGKIVSRITSDTQDFAQMIVLVTDLMSQIATLIILLVILFNIEWHLALILCIIAPVIMAAALLFRRIARSASRQASRVLAKVNNNIQESVAGIMVAKNFRQEQAQFDQFSAVNTQYYHAGRVVPVHSFPAKHLGPDHLDCLVLEPAPGRIGLVGARFRADRRRAGCRPDGPGASFRPARRDRIPPFEIPLQ
jgi:ATP-binding cassette subfamily B protein